MLLSEFIQQLEKINTEEGNMRLGLGVLQEDQYIKETDSLQLKVVFNPLTQQKELLIFKNNSNVDSFKNVFF